MKNFSEEQQKTIAEYQALKASDATVASVLEKLKDYLMASEYELILYMKSKNVWNGTVPPPPANFQPGDGTVDFGLFIFWFNNILKYFNNWEERLAAFGIWAAMGNPATQMTPDNYTYLTTHQLVYTDGSILSTEQYANFDQGWFVAFLNMGETVIRNLWYKDGNFPMPAKPVPVKLTGAKQGTVNIALVGDWGAGSAAAVNVMNQVRHMNPDYIIHLGDVYYGGTPLLADDPDKFKHYFSPGEEVNNFLNLWPSAFNGRSFALNSNHEMYSGANGLFYDVLNVANSPFSTQQGMSCFLLQYGDWNILGLDSAFYGSSTNAFMDGNIGPANGAQVAWITSLGLNPSKTIVLTHHTGFAYDASATCDLWSQVQSALGGDPYAWYWGHAHNGIAYANPVNIAVPGKPNFITNTYARCSGHASLPYGVSTALQNNDNVKWQASTPIPGTTQVYNGFAMLTLNASNNLVTGITENFYDPGGPGAKWSLKIF